MLDLRSLMILSTAAILTIMVTGMALLNTAGMVSAAHGMVLQSYNHRMILVELSLTGPVVLRKVEVNGVTAWKGKLTVTPSNSVLLIESIGSVKTFHDVHSATSYVSKQASLTFPGKPLPAAGLYIVKLYFDDGSVVVLTVTAPR